MFSQYVFESVAITHYIFYVHLHTLYNVNIVHSDHCHSDIKLHSDSLHALQ